MVLDIINNNNNSNNCHNHLIFIKIFIILIVHLFPFFSFWYISILPYRDLEVQLYK